VKSSVFEWSDVWLFTQVKIIHRYYSYILTSWLKVFYQYLLTYLVTYDTLWHFTVIHTIGTHTMRMGERTSKIQSHSSSHIDDEVLFFLFQPIELLLFGCQTCRLHFVSKCVCLYQIPFPNILYTLLVCLSLCTTINVWILWWLLRKNIYSFHVMLFSPSSYFPFLQATLHNHHNTEATHTHTQ
jgi:hypothetical protein